MHATYTTVYTLKKDCPIDVAFLCPSCGAPIVCTFHAHLEIERADTAFRGDAIDPIETMSVRAKQAEIRRIEACRTARQVLQSGVLSIDGGSTGCSVKSWLSHHIFPCPNCGHRAPWQEPSATRALEILPDKSFPTVFHQAADAVAWARKEAVSYIGRFKANHRPRAYAMDAVLLAKQQQELLRQKAVLPEAARCAEAIKERDRLTVQRRLAGAFAFQEKSALKKKIQALNAEIPALERARSDRQRQLETDLADCSAALRKARCAAFGYATTFEAITNDSATCYIPEPNPIPPEILALARAFDIDVPPAVSESRRA